MPGCRLFKAKQDDPKSPGAIEPASGIGLLADFSDQFDFHASAYRDLRHTKRAACMLARVAKHLDQQLTAPIGDQVVLGETAGGIDQAHHLDDALDLAQVADCRMQRSHQVNGNQPGGCLRAWRRSGGWEG